MRNVRPVKVGDCVLDGDHIYIQSMLNARSDDIEGSVKQAVELEKAGCEIIRAAIPNMEAVKLIPAIKEAVSIPLVADIHFDYKLAIEAASAGVDKIRINPGNIGDMDRVKAVVDACRSHNLPIRIGVNSGSLEKDILSGVRAVTADNIEFNSLRQRLIIVPPIELQEQFVKFVKQTDKSKSAVKQVLEKAETLKKALMQEYFG